MRDLQLLSLKEAAGALGRNYLFVYRLAVEGKLPVVKFDGKRRIFVRREDLERLLDQSTRREAA